MLVDEQSTAYPRAEPQPKRRLRWYEWTTLVFVLLLGVAIFMPVYGNPKHSAKRMVCLSNLKQMSLAAAMYASDNNERLPLLVGRTNATSVPASTPTYEDILIPYLKAERIEFSCPGDFSAKKSPFPDRSWVEVYGSSYRFLPKPAHLFPFGNTEGAEISVFIHDADRFHEDSTNVKKYAAAFYDGHAKLVADEIIFARH